MPPIVLAGLVLLFGSLVQGTIGFAFGLIAVPLLISAGYSLSQAVALTTICISIQVTFSVFQLREHIPWDKVKLAAIVRYLTMPIGLFLLLSIENMDTESVKRFVGVAVLIAVAIRLIPMGEKQRDLPLSVTLATFSISGILQGLVAMGGPPIVLWVTTLDFSAHQARALTLTLSLLNAPVQVFLLFVLSDSMTPAVLALALILSPLILIGTTIGVRIGNHFSKPLLNQIALAVLFVIALNSIF